MPYVLNLLLAKRCGGMCVSAAAGLHGGLGVAQHVRLQRWLAQTLGLWFISPASLRVGSRWGCATFGVEACCQHCSTYTLADCKRHGVCTLLAFLIHEWCIKSTRTLYQSLAHHVNQCIKTLKRNSTKQKETPVLRCRTAIPHFCYRGVPSKHLSLYGR